MGGAVKAFLAVMRCLVSKTQKFLSCSKRFSDWLRKNMADLMLNMGSRFCSNSVFLSSISHTEKSSMAFMITAMKIKNMMGKNHLSKPSDLLDGKSVAPEYQFIIHCEERKCFVKHFMNNLVNDFVRYMNKCFFNSFTLTATSCSRSLNLITMDWFSSRR